MSLSIIHMTNVGYNVIMKNKMSKLVMILFSLVLCLSITGCTQEDRGRVLHEIKSDVELALNRSTEITDTVTAQITRNVSYEVNRSVKPESVKEKSKLTIQFIDVGQADAALVKCDGHYMLIDGGDKSSSQKMYSLLSKDDIDELDIVVATHVHDDHIGGLSGALNYAAADIILSPATDYDSDAFKDIVKYAGDTQITTPESGDKYSLGDAEITIFSVNNNGNVNDTSIVLKIEHSDKSFLFMGDAEESAETELLNSDFDLSADVIKIGHHGSNTSTSEKFLKAVDPDYAIISVGKDNSFNFPTSDVLNRLNDSGVEIYRTDLNGDITLISEDKSIMVNPDRKATLEEILKDGTPVVKTIIEATPTPTPTPEATALPGIDYIGNKNTHKFHYSYCGSVKSMKESNKYYYNGTRTEMIAKGYIPCKKCNP